MKSDRLYLNHIHDAITQIETYLSDVPENHFFESRLVQDAVARQLEVIGEASRRLSDAFKERHPKIPWHAIIGMRNRIAHDYLNIDLRVIWEVTQHDLPALKAFVSKHL